MIYQGGVPLKKLQGVPKTYKIPISTQCSFKIIYCRHHQRQTLQVHVNNCHEKMSTKNVMKIISQNISKSLLSNSYNREWRHPCGRRNHRIRSEYLNTQPGVYMSVCREICVTTVQGAGPQLHRIVVEMKMKAKL